VVDSHDIYLITIIQLTDKCYTSIHVLADGERRVNLCFVCVIWVASLALDYTGVLSLQVTVCWQGRSSTWPRGRYKGRPSPQEWYQTTSHDCVCSYANKPIRRLT